MPHSPPLVAPRYLAARGVYYKGYFTVGDPLDNIIGLAFLHLADFLGPGRLPGTAVRLVFVHADKTGNAIRVTTNLGPLAALNQ